MRALLVLLALVLVLQGTYAFGFGPRPRLQPSSVAPVMPQTMTQANLVGSPLLVSVSVLLGQPELAAAAGNSLSAIPVARTVIDIFVNTLSLLFLCRTVLSWYPKTDLKQFPYSIAAWPTEPLLLPVRSLVPPAFGVDVSAIVWVMLLSFLREILTGQQGILTLLEKQ